MSCKKLKILCLHGNRQSGNSFRQKTGSLRKMLKNLADFHYITAPHRIPPDSHAVTDETPVDEYQYGWWITSISEEYSRLYTGFEESVSCVEKILHEEGPFDGVLGFSQGACFLSLLCALQQQESLKGNFRFAIFVAGFKSSCELHEKFYRSSLSIPTLHVFGETDKQIAKERSQDLAKIFEAPTTIVHGGGHYVPASGSQREGFSSFLMANR